MKSNSSLLSRLKARYRANVCGNAINATSVTNLTRPKLRNRTTCRVTANGNLIPDRYNQLAHLPHAPHHAELLRVNKAFQHDTDGHVHIILKHVVPKVHAGVCLGHADHRLYVTHGDRDTSRSLRNNIYY